MRRSHVVHCLLSHMQRSLKAEGSHYRPKAFPNTLQALPLWLMLRFTRLGGRGCSAAAARCTACSSSAGAARPATAAAASCARAGSRPVTAPLPCAGSRLSRDVHAMSSIRSSEVLRLQRAARALPGPPLLQRLLRMCWQPICSCALALCASSRLSRELHEMW